LSPLQVWIVELAATCVAVAVSAAWIDRLVARLVDQLLGRPEVVKTLGRTPSLFVAVVAYVALIVRRVAAQPDGRPDVVLLCCGCGIRGFAASMRGRTGRDESPFRQRRHRRRVCWRHHRHD